MPDQSGLVAAIQTGADIAIAVYFAASVLAIGTIIAVRFGYCTPRFNLWCVTIGAIVNALVVALLVAAVTATTTGWIDLGADMSALVVLAVLAGLTMIGIYVWEIRGMRRTLRTTRTAGDNDA